MSYMDYRVDYLDYLNDLGFRGVYDLLYTCMASLIKRKEQKQDTNEQEERSNEEDQDTNEQEEDSNEEEQETNE